jgi:hypothetical protein
VQESNAEIAELVGCSLATAKLGVHRARERLREAITGACTFEIDERGVLVCDPQPASKAERSCRLGFVQRPV